MAKVFQRTAVIVVLMIGCMLVFAVFKFALYFDSQPNSFTRTDKIVFFIEKNLPAPLLKRYQNIIESHNKLLVWNSDIQQRLVWGYVDHHSIKPGETFNVMLSTDPIDTTVYGHIEIFRIGNYGQKDRIKIWESESVKVQQQNIVQTASAIGLNWPISLKDIPTSTWLSGYYTIDFVDQSGKRDENIAYIVVTPSLPRGDILVKLSTNTYQAYNIWGGSNLYDNLIIREKGNIVSFDRPTASEFFEWEYYYIVWLEEVARESNLTVHYATDFDVHQSDEYTKNYALFISVGHDEYWSKEEFSNIYDRVFLHGKNTLFLSANSAYFQIRYLDTNSTIPESFSGRQMICYKKDNVDPIIFKRGQDPILDATGLFRKENRRSEIMLKGNGFQSWFPQHSHRGYPYYVVVNPEKNPLFKGTFYKTDETIGDVVGYEWDNTDPSPDRNRFWEKDVSKIPFLPEKKIEVLFKGYPIDVRGENGIAEAVYFESDAGAKVFSSGTIQWPWGLTKPGYQQEAFRKFNRNLIEVFTVD